MRRSALLLTSVAALMLAGVGAASADTAQALVDNVWTCDGQTCLRVLPPGAATPMDDSGCNHQVCIYLRGNATSGYSSTGEGDNFYGKIHVWGPNLDVWGNDSNNPTASGNGRGRGRSCAEGWKRTSDNSYTSVGLPCVPVN
jgi:hypothetical protein